MKRWRVGGLREQFLLNVLKREREKVTGNEREGGGETRLDGQVELTRVRNKEINKIAGLSKTGGEWDTDFHPWDQTTTNQPSLLKCKWGVSFQYETSAAKEKRNWHLLSPNDWQQRNYTNYGALWGTADNLNPWLTKYHFHISLLQLYLIEILHLGNKLFKYWHSILEISPFAVDWQVVTAESLTSWIS